MRAIIALILASFCQLSYSHQDPDVKVDVGLWSHHFKVDEDQTFNETHNLIGVEFQHMFIATFENSDFKRSVAVGMYSEKVCWKSVCGDLLGGIVTGYEYSVVPYIAPRVRVDITEDVRIQFLYYPTKEQVLAVGFQLEF